MKAILTYHSIDASGSPISASPAAFRRHVEYFRSARVRVLSVEDLLKHDESGGDAVALTFDDGYASVGNEAAPVLAEHGWPSTLFVVTGCVGRTNAWALTDGYGAPQLPLLDWDDLGRLAAGGMTLGNHTRTHPDLRRVSPDRLEDEIGGAAEDLHHRLGVRSSGFAYPYGAMSPLAHDAARRAHAWACTAEFAELPAQAFFDLPRIDMWYFERQGLIEQWGAPSFRRWVRRRHRLRRMRARWRRLVSG